MWSWSILVLYHSSILPFQATRDSLGPHDDWDIVVWGNLFGNPVRGFFALQVSVVWDPHNLNNVVFCQVVEELMTKTVRVNYNYHSPGASQSIEEGLGVEKKPGYRPICLSFASIVQSVPIGTSGKRIGIGRVQTLSRRSDVPVVQWRRGIGRNHDRFQRPTASPSSKD